MGRKRVYRILVGIPLHTKAGRERLAGILRFAGTRPRWSVTIVNTSEFLLVPRQDRLRYLAKAEPDGVLCATTEVRKTFLRANALRLSPFARVPIVFLDGTDDVLAVGSHVHMDNRAIGSAAARYFLDRGYRHLAYVGTNDAIEECYDRVRQDSFVAKALEKGVAAQSFRFNSETLDASSLAALAGFLKALPRPCGVFTYADWLSRSVLEAARLANLRVPGQIALLGVDDEAEICENTLPTLSSICPEFEHAGYLAAELLDRQIRSGRLRHADVVYGIRHLAERESATDLRGGGRLVSAADAYVVSHFAKRLTVEMLARHLKVSRRLLEIRYREINGTTVREAILAHRLEHVRTLLKTTNLPLGEIAARAGIPRYATLAVLFKRRFGHSLGEERKRLQAERDARRANHTMPPLNLLLRQ